MEQDLRAMFQVIDFGYFPGFFTLVTKRWASFVPEPSAKKVGPGKIKVRMILHRLFGNRKLFCQPRGPVTRIPGLALYCIIAIWIKVCVEGGMKMKSYCFRHHNILKLHFLFIATIIALIFSVNVSYGAIVVDLVHVETGRYPEIQAYVTVVDGNGDPITSLTASNFSILADGNAKTAKSVTYFPPLS